MTSARTIRRSGARDLPPSADSVASSVVSQPAGRALPSVHEIVEVQTFSGVKVRARITDVEPVSDGWIGWGEQISDADSLFKSAGVPPCGPSDLIRLFDWQVTRQGYR
jgi:hypothetical protein